MDFFALIFIFFFVKSVLLATEFFGTLLNFTPWFQPWKQGLHKCDHSTRGGLRCLVKSSDFTLWSLEKALEGLEQVDDVTKNTSWGFLVCKPCGE